jgi:PncC family amidohydrolase
MNHMLEALGIACVTKAQTKNARLALVESCTGGLIAQMLVNVPGASAVFDSCEVAYSNEAKNRLAGSDSVFARHGSVSQEAAIELALAMAGKTGADYVLASTGITGPAGGTKHKPVGTHFIAIVHLGTVTEVAGHLVRANGDVVDQNNASRAMWQHQFAKEALEVLSLALDGVQSAR